ncbi:helix-turn-helix domain-containing protein [Levilactobacillus sp. LN180102]|uniref:helix-turn-helix domain-containing protein n=1 Tax=Levilactobacillus sp. LN180102 TaxID=3417635 RepID=UPI003CFA8121
MKKLLDTYLASQGITRNKISRATKIATTTLQRSSTREADDINPRVLFAIAEVLHTTPGKVLDDLIKMEMKNDMTTSEIKLLLIQTLSQAGATALITVEDMGDGDEAVVAELDLPSGDTVRFAVNNVANDKVICDDVLRDLSYAMSSFYHEEDGEFYPDRQDEEARPLINVEWMGLSDSDAHYLSEIGDSLVKGK